MDTDPNAAQRPVVRANVGVVGANEKACTACNQVKPKSDFDRAATKDGLAHKCRDCTTPTLASETPAPAVLPRTTRHQRPPIVGTRPTPIRRVAAVLGVPESTITEWIEAGRLARDGETVDLRKCQDLAQEVKL